MDIANLEYKEFLSKVRKLKGSRKFKVTNSLGVYDAYKYYRKNKPKDKKYILTDSQYFSIIRNVNLILANKLSLGEDVVLPCNMGTLELRKYSPNITVKEGKIKTNLPINWVSTLQLWYEDTESFNNKTLVREEVKEIFRFYYNKKKANYNNKSFYEFSFNRYIKIALKNNIKKGIIDAYNFR